MNPAVGSHAAGSPDDAATVALQGASLAFQKRPTPQSSNSRHNTTATSDKSSRSHSPPLHNQQYSLEHYRGNGALLAATSSVERAKSPGAAAGLASLRSSHPQQRPGQPTVAAHASLTDIESNAMLPAGLVAARLQQLGVAPTTASTMTTTPKTAAARASSTSPSSHLALGLSPQTPASVAATLAKLDAKSPSLIAATLAASRNGSPTPSTSRKPRRMQSANALQELDAVDSQPIPPTNSLIFMFEADNAGGHEASPPRQIPRSSPEQSVVRKSKRATPIAIKQTTVASTSPVSKSGSKQRAAKSQKHDRPPTPPQTVDNKPTAAATRRPPTPPTAVDATLASAPTTPTAASKAIVHAAASKPRVTPPRMRETAKADGPSYTAIQPKIIPQSKSTAFTQRLDVSGELAPRKRAGQASSSGLRKESKDGHAPILSPPNNAVPATSRHKSPTPHVISRSTTEVLSPKPTRVTKAGSLRSGTPPPAIVLPPIQSPPSADPKKRATSEKRPPTPPKPRNSQRLAPVRSGSGRPRGNSDTPLSRATPNSMWGLPIVSSTTSSAPKPSRPQPPPPNRRESIVSAPPSPTHEPPRRRLTQSSSNPMQLNSMTNAIMASSLASSRLTPHNTGSSLPPPLPKRQRSPHLLQTLRQPQSEPEDDHDRQRKNRRHRLRGAKHTHHEGSRRRWRDQVTERERKRYEALWASNRGLLLTHASPSASVGNGLGTELSECVANVVVRDIWKRSRLPSEELAEVWELVDREHKGYLTRQEFVVGMFLIDQRLRGRKLPPRVSDSIWGSVNGVTVLKPRPKH